MKEILNHLFDHKTLSKAEAKEVLINIAQGKYNHSHMAAFLTVYVMRSITVDELEGFQEAMLELCQAVDLSAYDPIDLCGTGGDGKNTFNISTLSSFVVASSGVPVAKHGNHGVSSVSGSSTVLENLGAKFTAEEDQLRKTLDNCNICFLHAPLFHPAMKNVAPVRKALGIKTFFNMLGPMVNPAFPKKQLVGVFNLELARLYNYLYQKTNKDYIILHSLDGYDEISLTGATRVFSRKEEKIIQPQDLGLPLLTPEEIRGGDTAEDSAQLFLKILKGEGNQAQNKVVIANAGMAIHCARPAQSLEDSLVQAEEALLSKKALINFEKFISLN